MEDSSKVKSEILHPRAKANLLSAITFWWTLPIFLKGFKHDFSAEDLFVPLDEHKSEYLGNKFERLWNEEIDRCDKRKVKPRLFRIIFKVFFFEFMLYGIIRALSEIFTRLGQPFLLGLLLTYFMPDSTVSMSSALWYGFGLLICSVLTVMIIHPFMMGMFHIGVKVRIGCCALVYRKVLKLGETSLENTSVGKMINLLSNDVYRFNELFIFLHFLWIGPIMLLIVAYCVYNEMGLAGFGGIIAILLVIPTQGYLAKKTSVIRLRIAVSTDKRIQLMNEIITGIQVIKQYAWEKNFGDMVSNSRRIEMKAIRVASYIRSVAPSLSVFVTRFATYLSILSYLFSNNHITAQKVFVVTAYYNIIRAVISNSFPKAVAQLSEALVSIRRLEDFLLCDELVQNKMVNNENLPSPGNEHIKDFIIYMKSVTTKWSPEAIENTLSDVNLCLKEHQVIAVIGPVGSGKSSLLHVILRELPMITGNVSINGSLSYAAQEPWLFSGSVRQNIIFGRAFNKQRYQKVIQACGLQCDLQQFSYGDSTLVGERGIMLSGGQKARVSLARAVYDDVDIYLLDDPLSAVDVHIGKHLFEECIMNFLKDKTVILVTHQLQYLKDIDHIVVLNKGNVECQGTYVDIQNSGIDFAKLLNTNVEEQYNNKNLSLFDESGKDDSSSKIENSNYKTNVSHDTKEKVSKTSAPIPIAEMRSIGHVDWDIYKIYFKSWGNCGMIILVFGLILITPVVTYGGDYWLAQWTNMEEWKEANIPSVNKTEFSTIFPLGTSKANFSQEDVTSQVNELHGLLMNLDRETYIYVYSVFVFGAVFIASISCLLFFVACVNASVNLHNKMFESIVRASMYFFNTNPSGRILNRFSKDLGIIDENLPLTMLECFRIILMLISIMVIITVLNYWLLIPGILICFIFTAFRYIFLATSRSVKRLEGTTRSPVVSHLKDSLRGLATIRAMKMQDTLIKEFDNHQDLNTTAFYLFLSTNRAFGWWLDMGCLLYFGCVIFSFLLFSDGAVGGNVGLAITQTMGLTGMFQWGMRQSAEVENQMTSVERIIEFVNVEQEAPFESSPGQKPPKDWPSKGKIDFSNVFLRYSKNEPYVLKDLTFVIESKEKIGIVGRTGAGKSSLISALFRLSEPEGIISIDGIKTVDVGLHELRGRISLIPQEPLLFSGTIRSNLDPFEQFPDSVLWQALAEVELKTVIEKEPSGLSMRTSEGCANFSVGQRQLLCLARAIIYKNSILILDEATANVDPQTDMLIQKTIRRKFRDCTVLTIAHRLHTVIDNDKLLVIENGKIVEFAAPSILLQKSEGYLYQIAKESGILKELCDAVEAAHSKSA